MAILFKRIIGVAVLATTAVLMLVEGTSANPRCVWNQAYNENYDADNYDEIVSDAADCYVLVDPFNGEIADSATTKINTIKTSGNMVGCYISSGTCEDWRSDFNAIRQYCVDQQWGEWAGEYFVYDIDGILPHMKARIDQMETWGCDYVEFDNMDWCTDDQYRQEYGSDDGKEFPSTSECAQYNIDLCTYTREKGMLCMAKNTGYTTYTEDYAGGDIMDAGTFESYRDDFNWWSDSYLQGFLNQNKLVVIVHYDAGSNDSTNSCDYILNAYQARYNSGKISFICESRPLQKYIHYSVAPTTPSPISPTTNAPTSSGCSTPCTTPTDCVNDVATDDCGSVSCDTSKGVCSFNAWDESCSTYVFCDGNDLLCNKGPTGSTGQCTGWQNSECVYEYCPVNSACPNNPCTEDSDCDDGNVATNSCGTVSCDANSGLCSFNAWKEGCSSYAWCSRDDSKCTGGPPGSIGTCSGWTRNECVYHYCPGT